MIRDLRTYHPSGAKYLQSCYNHSSSTNPLSIYYVQRWPEIFRSTFHSKTRWPTLWVIEYIASLTSLIYTKKVARELVKVCVWGASGMRYMYRYLSQNWAKWTKEELLDRCLGHWLVLGKYCQFHYTFTSSLAYHAVCVWTTVRYPFFIPNYPRKHHSSAIPSCRHIAFGHLHAPWISLSHRWSMYLIIDSRLLMIRSWWLLSIRLWVGTRLARPVITQPSCPVWPFPYHSIIVLIYCFTLPVIIDLSLIMLAILSLNFIF